MSVWIKLSKFEPKVPDPTDEKIRWHFDFFRNEKIYTEKIARKLSEKNIRFKGFVKFVFGKYAIAVPGSVRYDQYVTLEDSDDFKHLSKETSLSSGVPYALKNGDSYTYTHLEIIPDFFVNLTVKPVDGFVWVCIYQIGFNNLSKSIMYEPKIDDWFNENGISVINMEPEDLVLLKMKYGN